MPLSSRIYVLLAALLLAACNGSALADDAATDSTTQDGAADGGDMDATDGATDAACTFDDASTPVTFTQVYAQIISQHCGGPSFCHFDTAMPTAGLDMSTESNARMHLVNVSAATAGFCTPADVQFRVAPGDPDHSMLWRRVSGTTCAERMPLGGPYLSCDDQLLIRHWIASGAN